MINNNMGADTPEIFYDPINDVDEAHLAEEFDLPYANNSFHIGSSQAIPMNPNKMYALDRRSSYILHLHFQDLADSGEVSYDQLCAAYNEGLGLAGLEGGGHVLDYEHEEILLEPVRTGYVVVDARFEKRPLSPDERMTCLLNRKTRDC